MANVVPAGGDSSANWYVYAIAYPSAPSTSVPLVTQTQYSGTNPLAGPFATKAEAEAWVKANQSSFGPGTTNIAPPVDTPVTSGIPGPSANPLSSLADLADRVKSQNFWVRTAEFIIGGILVFASVNHLLGNPAGKTAKLAGKAAIVK